MKIQFIPYVIPLFVSFLILTTLAVYGYKHRSVRGAKAFAISMIIGSLWALANALEMAGIDLETKLIWANVQYIAYSFAPVAWLIMVLQFTDRADWVTRKNIIIMAIIPVITVVLVWLDPLYGLVRSNFIFDKSGAISVINKDYQMWFWVHFIYCYLLNFATIVFLIRSLLLKNTIYRKQAFYLLIGFLVISINNIMYVAGFSPIRGVDLSPVSFSISGMIVGLGIFYFRLFDLVPIARATVIEKMGSGIVVIDKIKRIIDINAEAKNILGLSKKVVGKKLINYSPEIQEVISKIGDKNSAQTEFTLKDRQKEKRKQENFNYYELYISSIKDKHDEHIAWVLIINDITDLKLAREQINKQHQELAVMDERERMARDLHDNLGQVLSFSNIQIQAVRSEIKKGKQQLADDYLKRLNDIIKDAHKDIREYVYNIRDNSQYKERFVKLIEKEIEEVAKNSTIEVELIIDKKVNIILGIEEKMQLIHIVKEALTNILRYAEADIVKIVLKKKKELLVLIIEDDGKGIDATVSGGSGLNIMNERAKLIGGEFKIDSQPGRGTKIIVSFPI